MEEGGGILIHPSAPKVIQTILDMGYMPRSLSPEQRQSILSTLDFDYWTDMVKKGTTFTNEDFMTLHLDRHRVCCPRLSPLFLPLVLVLASTLITRLSFCLLLLPPPFLAVAS